MARAVTPPHIKAKAIADLLSGDQPAIVAERYGLPSGMVRKWKFRLGTADGTESVPSAVPKTPRTAAIRPAIEAQQLAIGELVMASLRAKIFATQKIAEYVTTPAWLDKQTASDVAELFETIDRAAVGILDRMAQRGDRVASPGGAVAADDGDRLPGGDLSGDR